MRLLFIPILFFTIPLFSQNWETIQTFGGMGNESLDALEIMDDGNVIVAGSFEEDFEIGGDILVSEGEEDIYCTIYSPLGNPIQSFQIGGASEEQLTAVTTHANRITLFGSYNLQADFDTITLQTSLGTKGLFISQYNTQGAVQWTHSIEGNVLSISGDITSSDNGDSFITGYFFDTLIIQQDTLFANSDEGDVFVAQFDVNGVLQWLSQAGDDGIMRSTGIVLDDNGDIFIAGKFKGEATFGEETIQTNTADHDLFLAKLNHEGDFLWGKKLGGVFEDDFGAMTIDNNGNIYLTGYFIGVLSSAEGWEIETDGININAYLIQLNSDGIVNWGHSIGGANDDYAVDISMMDDKIAMTGYFQTNTNWGNGNLTAQGGLDALVATYRIDGSFIGMIPVSGVDFEFGSQVKFLPTGEIITGGSFNGTCDFDGDVHTSNGFYDAYWGIRNSLVHVEEINTKPNFSFFPNPSSEYIYWNHTPTIKVSILDAAGKIHSSSNTGSMDIRYLASGIYFVKAEGYAEVRKLIIYH